MSRVLSGNACFHPALLTNQLKPLRCAENESGGGQDSSRDAARRDDADGLATVADWQTVSRIEDMSIATSADRERARVISRSRNRLIGQPDGGPNLARLIRLFEADVPGILARSMPVHANVLTDVDHHVGYSKLTGHRHQL